MIDVNPTELKEMLDVLNKCGVAQASFSNTGATFTFWRPPVEDVQPTGRDEVKEPGTPPAAKIRIVTDEEILLNPYAGLNQ